MVWAAYWAFFSVFEIPFPGNGDRSRRRLGSNEELMRRKSEHLVLAGPFGRQVSEADDAHALREPSFDRSLDEVGREEGERDCHIYFAGTAAVSRCDAAKLLLALTLNAAAPAVSRWIEPAGTAKTYSRPASRKW